MDEQKKLLTVSASPHAKNSASTTRVMLDVILALLPAGIMGVVWFGLRALLVIGVCVVCSVGFELVWTMLMKKPVTVGDLSAVVTGLLLAYNLPVGIPLWMCAVGSFAAIVVVKQFFGGLGQNFANPAITGRIILLVSFAGAMTKWTAPNVPDAVSGATPLGVLGSLPAKEAAAAIGGWTADRSLPTLIEMLFGMRGGCIGETCAAALLVGGLYLLIRRVISWRIPVCYVGTVAVFMLIVSGFDLTYTAYELLSGVLLLGAIFMATDYTTSPINKTGKIVFGVGCGVLTCVIRLYGSLPEGVSYSILLMNIVTPLIEKATMPKYFGKLKKKKEGKAA